MCPTGDEDDVAEEEDFDEDDDDDEDDDIGLKDGKFYCFFFGLNFWL